MKGQDFFCLDPGLLGGDCVHMADGLALATGVFAEVGFAPCGLDPKNKTLERVVPDFLRLC